MVLGALQFYLIGQEITSQPIRGLQKLATDPDTYTEINLLAQSESLPQGRAKKLCSINSVLDIVQYYGPTL